MLVVVGAALPGDHVLQLFLGVLLDNLLQGGLVVLKGLYALGLGRRGDKPQDEPLGLLQAAAVQVDGGGGGLEHVRQNAGALPPAGVALPVAQAQKVPHMEGLGKPAQASLADKAGPGFGQLALWQLGKIFKQVLRRDKPQHRVPQKLQPLVAFALVLVGKGGVGQGRFQQLLVAKAVANPLFVFFQWLSSRPHSRSPLHDFFATAASIWAMMPDWA